MCGITKHHIMYVHLMRFFDKLDYIALLCRSVKEEFLPQRKIMVRVYSLFIPLGPP